MIISAPSLYAFSSFSYLSYGLPLEEFLGVGFMNFTDSWRMKLVVELLAAERAEVGGS
jgi:hypothetical protein